MPVNLTSLCFIHILGNATLLNLRHIIQYWNILFRTYFTGDRAQTVFGLCLLVSAYLLYLHTWEEWHKFVVDKKNVGAKVSK